MKKVVNSVLASALALSIAPMVVGAEEAAQAPKMDAALEKTVKRLQALGLVAGYGNGDFGVDRTITRAEFATLVVRARGLEQGAKLAQFQSNFVDVKSSDWFAGFVNVASGQEIIKGYSDKTFKPQNQVTYAEAVAMIIRALGYEPSVRGVWPNNYIAKASELGIAKSITAPNSAATRGEIFKMLDNALSVDLMKQMEYGTDIRFDVREGETLLTEYLDVAVYDMDWAHDEDKDLPFVSNVPVVGLGDLKANEVEFDGELEGTYKVADGINVNAFGGQHVQVWVKDGREDVVVWMEGSEDENVINDTTDTFYLNGKVEDGSNVTTSNLSDLELKLGSGKSYSFDKDVKVTYNYKRFGDGATGLAGLKKIIEQNDSVALDVKIVLNDDNDIVFISAVDNASADNTGDLKYGSEVIEKVDVNKKKIYNLEDNSFDLKDKEEGEDFLVFLNGQPAKFADLKPLDVYSVFYADGDKDKPLIFATRNVVEGKVDKVIINSPTDNRLKIGDKTYRVRNTSYSDNANKDITKIDTNNQDILRDLDGEEVKVYLGADGRIRHIETKNNVNDRKFKAVITKSAVYDESDDAYKFSVLSEKGSKLNITVEEDDIEGLAAGADKDDILAALGYEEGDTGVDKIKYVEVTLDSKGEVDSVEVLDVDASLTWGTTDWDEKADEDDNTMEGIDGEIYDVTDETVVFDLTDEVEGTRPQLDDASIAKFSNIADDEVEVFYVLDGNEVEAIFVVDGDVASSTQYGYVTAFGRMGGDDSVTVLTKVDGKLESKEYKLDGDVEDAEAKFRRYDFIEFSLNSDNEVIIDDVVEVINGAADTPDEVDVIADPTEAGLSTIATAKVKSVNGTTIEATNGKEYLTSTSTLYFNTDFEVIDGVQEDDYVVLVETDDDGNRFDYVLVVTDQDEVDEEGYNMDGFLNGTAGVSVPAAGANNSATKLVATFSDELYETDGDKVTLDDNANVASYFTGSGVSITSATADNGSVTFVTYGATNGAEITSTLSDKLGNVVKFVYSAATGAWTAARD